MRWAVVAICFAAMSVSAVAGLAADSASIYHNSFAVLIGINKYPNLPPSKQLHWAVNDVTALKRVLVEKYDFPEANVTVLTDKAASKQGIVKALSALADRRRVGKEDRILVYFSGHGQTVKTDDGEMGFLLPSDANVDLSDVGNPGPYLETSLDMESLWKYLEGSSAKHALILADVCYSGLVAQSRSIEDVSPAAIEVLAVCTSGRRGSRPEVWNV